MQETPEWLVLQCDACHMTECVKCTQRSLRFCATCHRTWCPNDSPHGKCLECNTQLVVP